jgi:DNA repair protein RadC
VFRLVEVLVLVHKQLILPWDSHFEQTIDESRWSSLRDIATIHGKDDVAALLQVEFVPRPRPVPSRAERRDTEWLQALLAVGWIHSTCPSLESKLFILSS